MTTPTTAHAAALFKLPAKFTLPARITFDEPAPVFGRVAGMGRCVVASRMAGLFPFVPPAIGMRHVDLARDALRRAGHDAGRAVISLAYDYPGQWIDARRRGSPRALKIVVTIPCKPFPVAKTARAA